MLRTTCNLCNDLASDYKDILVDAGFLPPSLSRAPLDSRQWDGWDVHAGNFRVVRAMLGGGLYPNVVQIKLPERKYAPTTAGAMAVDHKAKEVKVCARVGACMLLRLPWPHHPRTRARTHTRCSHTHTHTCCSDTT